jgi:hypothetical protein
VRSSSFQRLQWFQFPALICRERSQSASAQGITSCGVLPPSN